MPLTLSQATCHTAALPPAPDNLNIFKRNQKMLKYQIITLTQHMKVHTSHKPHNNSVNFHTISAPYSNTTGYNAPAPPAAAKHRGGICNTRALSHAHASWPDCTKQDDTSAACAAEGIYLDCLRVRLPMSVCVQGGRVSGCGIGVMLSVMCRVTNDTLHMSHVTRHTSHVTRHTSHVTRHTSHVTWSTSIDNCWFVALPAS